MTPKEKAIDLVDKYKKYVHGYVGSSMLSNHEYPEQIVARAKKAAIVAVDELINQMPSVYVTDDEEIDSGHRQYWEEVKQEIEKL